ncbi:uncharacterized protein [Amphiura filiformis]|uniref:uncharacterized protein n=1 Tax=Amphiura filiformis TaxID=82378 RepID=UPI003B214648
MIRSTMAPHKGHTKWEVYLRPYNCKYCQQYFHDVTQYLCHRRRHEQQIHRYWYTCKKKLVPEDSAQIRKPERPYKCQYCNEDFEYFGERTIHEQTHTSTCMEELYYYCQYCNKGFSQKYSMKNVQKKDKKRPYRCQYSKDDFNYLEDLTTHEQTHYIEKPWSYQCPYCKIGFTYLRNHKHIHFIEKSYKCQYCKKGFSRYNHFINHERKMNCMTMTMRKKCRYCKKVFAYLRDLTTHEKTHDTKKLYQCQYCKKSFSKSSNLNSHEKTHTKPYKCQHCKKGFSKSRDLNNHERTHTKPYKCQHCMKSLRTF